MLCCFNRETERGKKLTIGQKGAKFKTKGRYIQPTILCMRNITNINTYVDVVRMREILEIFDTLAMRNCTDFFALISIGRGYSAANEKALEKMSK